MIRDELLSKFDRIHDLPVSEEMLGAYLEGNLSSFEESQVSSLISQNEILCDIVNENYNDELLELDIWAHQNDQINLSDDISSPIIFPGIKDISSILYDSQICASVDDNPFTNWFDETSNLTNEEKFAISDRLTDEPYSLDTDTSDDDVLFDDNIQDI